MLDREDYLRENLVKFAEESFPDNPGLEWIAHRFEHRGQITFIEVEPRPDEVGYSRFRLVFSFEKPAEPCLVGCYCLDKGTWILLFDDGSKRKLPRTMT